MAKLENLRQAAACPLCGMPVALPNAPCPGCQSKGIRNFQTVTRLATFEEPLRNIIHQLKYHRRWILGDLMADWLWEQPAVKRVIARTSYLVPVPLHPIRQIVRGYNQAEVIAKRLGSHAGASVVRPVIRVRDTESQTHLHSRAQRMQNLRNAFRLSDNADLKGKEVVVIDDVMTTGATLQMMARALKRGKPASLHAVVLAVADPKGRGFEVI